MSDLTDNLFDIVSISATNVGDVGGSKPGDNPPLNTTTDPSVFDLTITGSDFLPDQVFDGYCIQPWLRFRQNSDNTKMYYTTEKLGANLDGTEIGIVTYGDLNQDGIVDQTDDPSNPDRLVITSELLAPSVWLLNNLSWQQLDADPELEGVLYADDGVTVLNPTDDGTTTGNPIYFDYFDVQAAIWSTIFKDSSTGEGIYAPDYPAGTGTFDTTPYGNSAFLAEEDSGGRDATDLNSELVEIIETNGADYQPTVAGDKAGILLLPGNNGQFILSTLELLEPPTGQDPAALGDRVWCDANKNGIQDEGEPGINGVTVILKDSDGNIITTTTANIDIDGDGTLDGDGLYKFDNLEPGSYSVKFVLPDGYDFTLLNQGGDDSLDSDADPDMDGMTQAVTLTSGEFNRTLDAGLIPECCKELSFIVNENISGQSVNVEITLTEVEGGVQFTISAVDEENNLVGDIRALFFNIADDNLVSGLSVEGDDVTDSAFEANEIDKELGNDAIIKGGGNQYVYDGGVEIGTQGKAKDDIQSTTFIISHDSVELDIEDFLNQGFGVRLTSVGDPFGSREESSKLIGTSPEECICDCFHPETISI